MIEKRRPQYQIPTSRERYGVSPEGSRGLLARGGSHPGAIGRHADFEEFEPFIRVNDSELRERFVAVLKELHRLTGNVWNPQGCYSTEYLQEIVQKAKGKGRLAGVNFSPKAFLGYAHFFLVAELEGRELVVDPFGVPDYKENYSLYPETITPFFGEVELAPPKHQRVYQKSEPLGESGYHHFKA